MKWTLKLISEFDAGETKVQEVASMERDEAFIKPARLGMSIEESKLIAASIQTRMVSDQVDRHKQGSDGLPLLWSARKDEGILQVDLQVGVRQGAHAGAAGVGLSLVAAPRTERFRASRPGRIRHRRS